MTYKRQLYLNVSLFIVADIDSTEDGEKTMVTLKNVHESHKGSIAEPDGIPAKTPEWAEAVAVIAAKEAMKHAYENMGKEADSEPAPEPEPTNQFPPPGGASA